MKNFIFINVIIIFIFISNNLSSKDRSIIMATTTSAYDTGLLTYLNEQFKEDYGINVKVISLGTGQALRVAKDGNVEVVLVHDTSQEIKFIENGYGLMRYNLMYNDYILVGPKKDNNECNSLENKLRYIYNNKLSFISRDDQSGTHNKELELWKLINLDPLLFDFWYYKIGQGMGNALLFANNKEAYTLSDRGTWISFNAKENLKIICENYPPLINQYGLIIVNPELNNNLKINEAEIYVNWLLSSDAKNMINNFKIKEQQLFFFNYN